MLRRAQYKCFGGPVLSEVEGLSTGCSADCVAPIGLTRRDSADCVAPIGLTRRDSADCVAPIGLTRRDSAESKKTPRTLVGRFIFIFCNGKGFLSQRPVRRDQCVAPDLLIQRNWDFPLPRRVLLSRPPAPAG